MEHIKNEKDILSDVNHPFIVVLYNSFQDERNLYLVLDLAEGGTLKYHLRRKYYAGFAPEHARFYAAQRGALPGRSEA